MSKKEIKKVKDDEFYTPREVAEITGTAPTKDSRKQMVLRHIRDGKLPAKNIGGEKMQRRYVVRGKDLKDYHKAVIGRGGYTTK